MPEGEPIPSPSPPIDAPTPPLPPASPSSTSPPPKKHAAARFQTMDDLRDHLSRRAMACPNCGYNLYQLFGDVCPECGLQIDPAEFNPRSPEPLSRLAILCQIGMAAWIGAGIFFLLPASLFMVRRVALPAGLLPAVALIVVSLLLARVCLRPNVIWRTRGPLRVVLWITLAVPGLLVIVAAVGAIGYVLYLVTRVLWAFI